MLILNPIFFYWKKLYDTWPRLRPLWRRWCDVDAIKLGVHFIVSSMLYVYILCDEKCCLPPHVLYINEHVCSRTPHPHTHIHLWHIIYVQINKLTTAWMRVSVIYSMLFAPSVNEFNLIFFGAALKQIRFHHPIFIDHRILCIIMLLFLMWDWPAAAMADISQSICI